MSQPNCICSNIQTATIGPWHPDRNLISNSKRVLQYAEESSQEKAARDIIAMDKTAVWFDMVSPTTIDTWDAKSVALKTTGHEKSHRQQTQASSNAAADFQRSDCYTFNTDWLQSVVGKFNFTLHLLDSYHCHISAATKAELKCGYNVITVVISGGCTKYIQAPHVMWNQSFKQNLHDAYDQWMAGDIDKE